MVSRNQRQLVQPSSHPANFNIPRRGVEDKKVVPDDDGEPKVFRPIRSGQGIYRRKITDRLNQKDLYGEKKNPKVTRWGVNVGKEKK